MMRIEHYHRSHVVHSVSLYEMEHVSGGLRKDASCGVLSRGRWFSLSGCSCYLSAGIDQNLAGCNNQHKMPSHLRKECR